MSRTRLSVTASVLTLILTLSVSLFAQVSVTTSRNNNHRDGQNVNETILTPTNVNAQHFGKLFSHYIDGYVYGQPLYVPNVKINGVVHNVVYVVSEHDTVFAYDADSNTGSNAQPLWYHNFLNPPKVTSVSSDVVQCSDLIPEIGITSTPVIDPVAGTLYTVAKTQEGSKIVQRLHALDITTGLERGNSPVEIKGSVKGNGAGSVNGVLSFDPLHQAQRPGLLLQNGNVYIAWASHCDNGPYHGWVASYDQNTLSPNAVWNSNPNGYDAGIWQSGTGLAGDGTNIFVATGNGDFDGITDYGDTVAKITPGKTHLIPLTDFFTPYNQNSLNGRDEDLGSGGVLMLPDQDGPYPHLLILSGKEGSIYLVNRDGMGNYNSVNNSQIVQDLENAIGGLWSTPAFWNNNVYFGGSGDNLRQFTFDPLAEQLSDSAVSKSGTHFGFPGPTPSISANGNANGIVWVLQNDAYGSGGNTILHAYDATNLATELYNSTQNSRDAAGGAVKFSVPTVANGKVYVGSVKKLVVYGLR